MMGDSAIWEVALLLEPDLGRGATRLALRAVMTLPQPLGYLGIDMILGERSDGSDDVVIEINPARRPPTLACVQRRAIIWRPRCSRSTGDMHRHCRSATSDWNSPRLARFKSRSLQFDFRHHET